jgi:small subunit ribosomal protein S20
MPIIKSAIKRVKQTKVRQERNYNVRTATRKAIRFVTEAIKAGDKKAASAALQTAQSQIDIATKKGIMHKNTAARRKSLLSRNVAGIKEKKAVAAKKAPAKKKAAKK